jgi:uncharacterized protein (TIGR03083 family)
MARDEPSGDDADPGVHYRRSRLRLTALLADADTATWARPVPACPGWDVHAVVAHLVGIVEDALAGELDGTSPPGPERTGRQVARHRDDDPAGLLTRWDELVGPFEAVIGQAGVWPAAFDAVSHEHDVRGALDRPGARDDALVRTAARMMIEGLNGSAVVEADLGDGPVVTSSGTGATYRLRTTPFEVFRFRLGRRTVDQVRALDWAPAPPETLLDELFVFGPAPAPVVE